MQFEPGQIHQRPQKKTNFKRHGTLLAAALERFFPIGKWVVRGRILRESKCCLVSKGITAQVNLHKSTKKKINDNAADDVLFFCRISQPYLNFFFFPPALNNNTQKKHGTQIV